MRHWKCYWSFCESEWHTCALIKARQTHDDSCRGLTGFIQLNLQVAGFVIQWRENSAPIKAVLSMWGRLCTSLTVWTFNFLRSIQNLRLPPFFCTRMTVLAYGLLDFWCFLPLQIGKEVLFCSLPLKGISSVIFTVYFTMEVLPNSRTLRANRNPNSVMRTQTQWWSPRLPSVFP